MQDREDKSPSRIHILAWALGELADEHYVFETDDVAGGWELHIYDPKSDESGPPVTEQQGRQIEERLEALKQVIPDYDQWAAILTRMIARKFIHKGRERLLSHEDASLEQMLLGCGEEMVGEEIASACLKEFARDFKKLVRRAEELRILSITAPVSSRVQTYLAEATRSYVYGRYSACLLVCRSAIEFALGDFLTREGKEEDVRRLREEERDGLWELIKLARSLQRWRLKPTLDDADEIRRKANRAVHSEPLEATECKELFIRTRGVLRELYL